MPGRHTHSAIRSRLATAAPDSFAFASRVKVGAMFSVLGLGGVQAVSLVQTVLLARLLTPAEIGVFAAGTVLSAVLVSVSEGGLRAALIQRDGDIRDAADTVFWATLLNGCVLGAGALAVAPLLTTIFQDERAGLIAAVMSANLVLHSLTNVPDGLMQRRLDVRRRLIVDPGKAIVYACVSISLAASGVGFWALIWASYASMAFWVASTWRLAGWRPGFGTTSWRLWRDLARFAFPLLLQGLVGRARDSLEVLLVGGRFLTDTLGQYRYARRLSALPATVVVEAGAYVLFPAFARMAADGKRFAAAYLSALRAVWLLGALLGAATFALGESTVVLVLGEQWRPAGVGLVAMAGFGIGISLQSPGSEVIKAAGRSRAFHITSATSLIGGIGLLLILLPLGLIGVGIAISATEVGIGIVVLVLAQQIVPVAPGELARVLSPPAASAIISAVAVITVEEFLPPTHDAGLLLSSGRLGIDIVILTLTYVGSLALVSAHYRALINQLIARTLSMSLRRRNKDSTGTQARRAS